MVFDDVEDTMEFCSTYYDMKTGKRVPKNKGKMLMNFWASERTEEQFLALVECLQSDDSLVQRIYEYIRENPDEVPFKLRAV